MRIFTILSVFLAAIPLCFSEPISLTQTPTTTAPATVTLPLGDDDVQSGWQVYPPDPQLLDDIPPSVLAHFDLMVRSMELDARAASKVYLLPLRCSDGGELIYSLRFKEEEEKKNLPLNPRPATDAK